MRAEERVLGAALGAQALVEHGSLRGARKMVRGSDEIPSLKIATEGVGTVGLFVEVVLVANGVPNAMRAAVAGGPGLRSGNRG